MNNPNDTPRTDALMVNGCIAINIMEHARTLERELNNTPPTAPSGEVWPEILRLQGKIASLDMQLTASLGNQLQSEETISQLLSQIPQASTEDSSVVQTDTPRTDAMQKRYITVVYEIADETEWRKTNPLRYAHNGLSAVRVSLDDACELLDEAEAEVERLRDALDTLTLVVGLTPIAGNKEALQEAFNLARKALNPTEK